MEQLHSKKIVVFIYVALTLATIIAFEPICHNDFVALDDFQYVTDNQHVKAGITYKSFIWSLTSPGLGNWHPLTWLSHMLDCQLYGLNPLGHHLTNVLFHIANALLLFWILKKMTGSTWSSAFVAAIFALHPLRVESVAWVSERKDVLSTFFGLLTIAAYYRYARQVGIGRYLLVVLFFALSLMAKSMLVTLPFVLLLLDYWPLERLQLRTILEKIPLFILAAISSVITFIVQQSAGAVTPLGMLPLSFRFTNAVISYIRYLGKMFFPHDLAVLYPFSLLGFSKLLQIASIAIVIGISIAVIYTAGKRRYLFVGWFWYLGTMIPVIGLVQAGGQSIADRYTYVPLIGICIMFTWGIVDVLGRWRFRKITLAILSGVLIVALTICTRLQVGYWKDSLTLYKHTIDVTEDNSNMHKCYGRALNRKGRPVEAIKHFKIALQIKPKYFQAYCYMGESYFLLGRIKQAFECWYQTLKINPNCGAALNNLAWVKATHHDTNIHNPDEAVRLALRACEKTEFSKANFVDTLAVAFAAAGKFSRATETAEKAVELAVYNDKNELAQQIRDRLKLYKNKIPYRDLPSEHEIGNP